MVFKLSLLIIMQRNANQIIIHQSLPPSLPSQNSILVVEEGGEQGSEINIYHYYKVEHGGDPRL